MIDNIEKYHEVLVLVELWEISDTGYYNKREKWLKNYKPLCEELLLLNCLFKLPLDPSYRNSKGYTSFRMTDKGKKLYEQISILDRLQALESFVVMISEPPSPSQVLFESYLKLLTSEELPKYLSHSKTWIRELAAKRYKELNVK